MDILGTLRRVLKAATTPEVQVKGKVTASSTVYSTHPITCSLCQVRVPPFTLHKCSTIRETEK